MRALIVDDDFYSRSFLEYILHPYARCEAAVNGEDAIMVFKQAIEQGDPYTVVFMDLLMPVIDGPRALNEIREIEKDYGVTGNACCKIIITSVLEDGEETHNAMYLGGATSFLQKPVDERSILTELTRLGCIQPDSDA